MRPAMADKSRRLLVVIYDLANGRSDVPVQEEAIIRHAAKLGVFRMTAEQFEAYRLATVARVQAHRKANAS